MVLGALTAFLQLEPDIDVVGGARNGREAYSMAQKLVPDIVVTDIEMPEMTGLELIATLHSWMPDIKSIIVTTFGRPGYLRRALEVGARGYLLKDRPASELVDAVRRVHRGHCVIDQELAAEVWQAEVDPLTERERQILQRAADGQSSLEIASEFRLSDGTVRNYLSRAISKMGVSNRIEAARIARAKGWL